MTKCLYAVYEGKYTFEIEFVRRRGKTEAELWFVEGGHRVAPRDSSGGARDVASLGLRLAKLLMERPARRKLIVLDEPFKNVHGAEKRRRAANLILTLANEMKVQFVIVTGLEWLKVGKVVEL